jgi:hypothetical protein
MDYNEQLAMLKIHMGLRIEQMANECRDYSRSSNECKYIKRPGESCTLNNNCKYPNCDKINNS